MIKIKSAREIEIMKTAGRITAQVLAEAGLAVRPGATTHDINSAAAAAISRLNAIPSFLGYNGFPASCCVSINDEVIHGIPSKTRVIREGDIVKVDVGAIFDGYHGDCAATFHAGAVSSTAAMLTDVTRQSFYEGIKYAREGCRVSDISAAIQRYVEQNGFSAVRKFIGHGIGSEMHEAPEVPNFGIPGQGPRLLAGMTLAIEPMINAGSPDVMVKKDGWTVVTSDGSLSSHYENTVLITKDEPVILTAYVPDG